MKLGLLFITLLLAVSLSVSMWIVGTIPFDFGTFSLHFASIYIGVSGVLIYQRWIGEQNGRREK